MDSRIAAQSFSARFIRIGACIQFALVAIGLIPPVGRLVMGMIHTIDSIAIRESLSYVVFCWILGAPVVATILYTRLTTDQKTGTDGLLLLFWWISLFAMLVVALSFGAAF